MRYIDIIAESDIFAKARKNAEATVKARQKIADAERKKVEAARKYQDALRTANDRQQAAHHSLQTINK